MGRRGGRRVEREGIEKLGGGSGRGGRFGGFMSFVLCLF